MIITTRSEQRSFEGVQGFYEHPSELCGGPMKFAVYLPPGASNESKVPVLYYLAGLTCNEETFVIKSGFQRFAAGLGIAVVTCDTSPRSQRFEGDDVSWDFGQGAGFYLDATKAPWSSAYRMKSYVKDELRSLVESNFPVDGSRRGIFGHSMGGHGALTLGLAHPEIYQSVSAFAPIVAPSLVPWGQKAFSGYLEHESEWAAYDACSLVRKQKTSGTILVDQGTDDKFLARELKPELFAEACAEVDQKLELHLHTGYDHSYYFISTFVEKHLSHHARALS